MALPTGDIAVIGLALHVPGATSKDQFWHNLLAGRDCLTRSTEQTLNRKGLPWSRIRDPRCRLVAPSISDRQYFDAGFFDIPPFEARQTAESHRLFLQCAWEALEDAAVVPGSSDLNIGVFAGAAAGLDKVTSRKKSNDEIVINEQFRDRLETGYMPPEDEQQLQLCCIWEEVLGVSPIGIDDDFFSLGGDSISAIQVQFAVQKAFEKNLSMSAILRQPTIRELATLLS